MKKHKIIFLLFLSVLISLTLCVPAFALTESEVEAQVAASSKEAVTGNVLIWFLCAVAFLKVSQKIDSFMASLGVNVGHTGGSMLADAMITFRAVTMASGGAGRILGGSRGGSGGSASGASQPDGSGSSGLGGFFKGGLIGMAGRHVTNSAVKTATSQTSAVHTAHKRGGAAVHSTSEKQSAVEARMDSAVHSGGIVHTDSTARTDSVKQQDGVIVTGQDAPPAVPPQIEHIPPAEGGISPGPVSQQDTSLFGHEVQSSSVIQTEGQTDRVLQQEGVIQTGGGQVIHSSSEKSRSDTVHQGGVEGGSTEHRTVSQTRSVENTQRSTHTVSPVRMPTLGGMVFSNSLQSGGQFANDVIGMVARGDMRSTGSITGDLAAQSLQSYMGHTALGESAAEKVTYSQVEIGGGRITGREITPEHPQGIEFAMYHAGQYAKPEGDYQKVFSADGAQWYKQQAVDTVTKTPFKAPDGEIGYQKEIVKRLPTPPKRKDRI